MECSDGFVDSVLAFDQESLVRFSRCLRNAESNELSRAISGPLFSQLFRYRVTKFILFKHVCSDNIGNHEMIVELL